MARFHCLPAIVAMIILIKLYLIQSVFCQGQMESKKHIVTDESSELLAIVNTLRSDSAESRIIACYYLCLKMREAGAAAAFCTHIFSACVESNLQIVPPKPWKNQLIGHFSVPAQSARRNQRRFRQEEGDIHIEESKINLPQQLIDHPETPYVVAQSEGYVCVIGILPHKLTQLAVYTHDSRQKPKLYSLEGTFESGGNVPCFPEVTNVSFVFAEDAIFIFSILEQTVVIERIWLDGMELERVFVSADSPPWHYAEPSRPSPFRDSVNEEYGRR